MFKFRLTPILKIRENVRRERQAELVKAQEAEVIVLEKIAEIKQKRVDLKDAVRSKIQEKKINVDFMITSRRHEAFLIAQQTQIEEKLEILRKEIEKRREALLEADKEVQVMEKLRDKQKEQYETQQRAMETVLMDEIGSQKAARKISSVNQI